MTVDLHTDQVQGFFDGPGGPHVGDAAAGRATSGTSYADRELAVVSPDISGRVRLAEKWLEMLGGTPLAFIHKTWDPLKPNRAVANRVVGDLAGKTCVVIDDVLDTGGTIAAAVALRLASGAAGVVAAATHGSVLSVPAKERLSTCGAREIVVTTNTLPIPEEKRGSPS